MNRISTLLLFIFLLILNLSIWIGINKPFHPVNTQYPFDGLSFNPYQEGQSPFDNITFTPEQLDKNVKVLKGKTLSLRTYSALHGMEALPKILEKYHMKLILTAWLDSRSTPNDNKRQVESAINLTRFNRNVSRILIGNETQLHETVPEQELIQYLDLARKRLNTPVSTAEPWDFWLEHPEFVDHVDFLAIHILPYWLGISVDDAAQYVFDKYQTLKKRYPYKKIVIMETGWPSDGPQRGAAVPSLANQATFIRSFVRMAREHKIEYNIIEAFDQPWKSEFEGRSGEHWGILTASRKEKFPIEGPMLKDPNWKYWAMSSCLFGLLAAMIFFYRRSNIRFSVKVVFAVLLQIFISLGIGLAREAADDYMSPGDIVFWSAIILGQFLLGIIFLTDAGEIADVVGKKPLKSAFKPIRENGSGKYPFVSIHVACCKEPPDLVIQTLNSLAKLNYSNFEVIVIDNNTPDPTLWEPVKAHCETLGSRFRFFTLGKHPGFKAGALNFALSVVDPRTEIVGVVDADYIVDQDWLAVTIPYFSDESVAVVQAPQEHRDYESNLFQRMENDEYSGFFRIGMVQRNEDNALIQHGTMTLISYPILKKLKGWSEWCICEDTELGLRILNEGKHILYVNHPLGWGLVPDSFESYSKQRYRWAYGGMRIFRRHFAKILGFGKLTLKQRMHFVDGWLTWIGDALHMLFTFAAIAWNIVLMLDPLYTDFPEPVFLYPVLLLFLLRTVGIMATYRARVGISKRRTFLAMLAGGALTHRIAKAVIKGLFTSSLPFFRTPKTKTKSVFIKNLFYVREEIILASLLNFFATWIILKFGFINYQSVLWAATNSIQSIPYLAAIIVCLISSKTNPSN